MEQLRTKARELLQTGAANVVVGYGAGSSPERVRAIFVCTPEQADGLVFHEHCRQNLAVYLARHEVKALGKAAVVATLPTLRTILQLASEGQIADGQIIVLAVSHDPSVTVLNDLPAIEKYVASLSLALAAEEEALVARIEAMSREERWAFWQEQFSKCLKCYACRSACPMCYCSRCVVDCNRPQWVSVAPHALGNLEWHLARAMHLAGRCADCGSCSDACPVGIPLNRLTQVLAREIAADFGLQAGATARREYALSTFKTDDKEGFIR